MLKKILKKIKKKISRKDIRNSQLIKSRNEGHLKRLRFYKNRGIDFNNVLDIGACNGSWSLLVKSIFPEANILMVEANNDKEQILKKIGNYKIALLSSEADMEVNYYKSVSGDTSGNSIYLENTNYKFLPERRITTTLKLIVPKNVDYDLIKMDVQGSELDIIKGGLDIIKKTKFLLLELQIFEYNKDAPMLSEVLTFLKKINFDLVDIFDLLYSSTGSLIQIDGFFVNRDFYDQKSIL
ncbi:MAG: FkbM family methyltransferase [Proteobacteria bacterium]|jgi:FkbM family methyltransferase|nr:FkbM family methyltransferase [Candidatus Fonsibacter lacus]